MNVLKRLCGREQTDEKETGNVWTLTLTRKISMVLIGPTKKEEAEKRGWDDAIEQGIITKEEVEDNQWGIEATLGATLSWREDE